MPAGHKPAPIVWRFGDHAEDAQAWLAQPHKLHVYVDFQSPETPPGQWHRVTCVTHSWLRDQLATPMQSAFWPSMIVVPDADKDTIDDAISRLLDDSGWRLVVRHATLLPAGYVPTAW